MSNTTLAVRAVETPSGRISYREAGLLALCRCRDAAGKGTTAADTTGQRPA
jgi:hypothetical protein